MLAEDTFLLFCTCGGEICLCYVLVQVSDPHEATGLLRFGG